MAKLLWVLLRVDPKPDPLGIPSKKKYPSFPKQWSVQRLFNNVYCERSVEAVSPGSFSVGSNERISIVRL